MFKIKIVAAEPQGGAVEIIHGQEVPFEKLYIGDLTSGIAEAEAYLSRLTGLVVKIETGEE